MFFGCSREIEEPEPPLLPKPLEPLTVVKDCNPKDVCCFDLSDQEGVFDIYSSWEFVEFLDVTNKPAMYDNLTCLARIAVFALGGEDYENVFKVTLQFSKEDSEFSECQNSPAFSIRTFSHKITGCYSVGKSGGLTLSIPADGKEFMQIGASTTLPVLQFEYDFLKAIESVESYELVNNKLYLTSSQISEKLLFIAIED